MRINSFRRANADRLRANATHVETVLWRRLRRLEIEGSHFRRQVPIGPYVADFACTAAGLVVEIDGSQHAAEPDRSRDARRTRFLEAEGYRVIRFWNNEIIENMNGVMDTIYAALYGSREHAPHRLVHERHKRYHPTPARSARRPSPSRGG